MKSGRKTGPFALRGIDVKDTTFEYDEDNDEDGAVPRGMRNAPEPTAEARRIVAA